MNRGLIEARAETKEIEQADQLLPRFMNRGLIEADLAILLLLRAAPLPRFMNRGLIEAISVTASPRRIINFPDS